MVAEVRTALTRKTRETATTGIEATTAKPNRLNVVLARNVTTPKATITVAETLAESQPEATDRSSARTTSDSVPNTAAKIALNDTWVASHHSVRLRRSGATAVCHMVTQPTARPTTIHGVRPHDGVFVRSVSQPNSGLAAIAPKAPTAVTSANPCSLVQDADGGRMRVTARGSPMKIGMNRAPRVNNSIAHKVMSADVNTAPRRSGVMPRY